MKNKEGRKRTDKEEARSVELVGRFDEKMKERKGKEKYVKEEKI